MKRLNRNGWAVLSTILLVLHLPAVAQESDTAARIPVAVVEVEAGSIRQFEFAQGTVRSTRREYLVFESSGRVGFVKSNADGGTIREGDTVTSGELLAALDDRRSDATLQTATANLDTARSTLRAAQADFQRAERLLAGGAIAGRDHDNARAAYEQALAGVRGAEADVAQSRTGVSETQLRAPFDGVVAFVNLREGQYVNPQQFDPTNEASATRTAPIVVIDPTSFEIVVDVPLYVGTRVKAGQNAYLLDQESLASLQAIGDVDNLSLEQYLVPARVVSVSPAVNPEDRSIRARIMTDEVQDELLDGDFVTVWLEVGAKSDAVVAPLSALLQRANRTYIYVVDKNNRAERREVELGLIGFDGIEVLSGVEIGDRVVTKGKSRLRDGSLVMQTGAASTEVTGHE